MSAILRNILVILMSLAACTPVLAAAPLEVTEAVLRPGLAKGLPAVAYATIVDHSGHGDVLLGVSMTGADASLHETREANGISQMRPATSVMVPAGGKLEMKPGGVHIMIMGLGAIGAKKTPITLRFRDAGEVTADFKVTP